MREGTMALGELYEGLQALTEMAFPKACSGCGTSYAGLQAFLAGTYSAIHSSGLSEAGAGSARPLVALYRTCRCGTPLVEFFRNRRDESERGILVRAKFARLLEILQKSGIDTEAGRTELLKLLRGEPSERLSSLGFDVVLR